MTSELNVSDVKIHNLQAELQAATIRFEGKNTSQLLAKVNLMIPFLYSFSSTTATQQSSRCRCLRREWGQCSRRHAA
jgi:hypothetical protein